MPVGKWIVTTLNNHSKIVNIFLTFKFLTDGGGRNKRDGVEFSKLFIKGRGVEEGVGASF